MRKIVVLNSGGFDSIILMKYLGSAFSIEDIEIHSLHFCYGENNMKQQLECSHKVSKEVGAIHKVIELPIIDWTSKEFYSKDSNVYEKQYLEYRNLIFLSYALSYAESIGADKIYLATLKSHGYVDTNDLFFEGLNHFSVPLTGIEIVRPFSDVEKEDLLYYANLYGVTNKDFFSCDTPNSNGEPCGECDDCFTLSNMLKIDHFHKALVRSGYDYSDQKFKELLVNSPIEEVRLLINNDCQLKCSHCFYGFSETISPVLKKEELFGVIEQANELGVKNIHFSGKEPLYNDDILWYAEKIHNSNMSITFDLVTNGINIPKYAERLKELGLKKFYLSVDDVLNCKGVRSVTGVTDKALKVCSKLGIDVEIFIDLHNNNYNKVAEIIEYILGNYTCVKSFFVRTIRSLGSAENQKLLTVEQLEQVYSDLMLSSEKFLEIMFSFSIGIEYEEVIYEHHSLLGDTISDMDLLFTQYVKDNFFLSLEDCCARYHNQVTVTPDGYVLGCASEVSSKSYDKLSVGNIKDYSLKDLITKGKSLVTMTCNDNMCSGCKKCSFLL